LHCPRLGSVKALYVEKPAKFDSLSEILGNSGATPYQ
jgi:hypothetical protein